MVTRNQVTLKEMVYGYERKRECLVHGSLGGIEFKIMNYGTHPCSYIRLTNEQAETLGYSVEHPYEDKQYCYELWCHGGCTYTDPEDPETKEKQDGYIWAGWDYGHAGDFMGYVLRPDWPGKRSGEHMYTTDELLDEMEDVIDSTLLYLADRGKRGVEA